MFWSVGWPLLRAEGFFCNLDILFGGLGIGKLQFLIKKKNNFFSAVIFFQFLVIKALDPDWIRIRIGVHPKMLDPDEMNADPQPWCNLWKFVRYYKVFFSILRKWNSSRWRIGRENAVHSDSWCQQTGKQDTPVSFLCVSWALESLLQDFFVCQSAIVDLV